MGEPQSRRARALGEEGEMKYPRSFALVALTAAAFAASFAAAPAGAASLCTTNTSPCTGFEYGLPVNLSAKVAEGFKVGFTLSFANVECTNSTIEWEPQDVNAGKLTGPITKLSFGNCTNCTVTVLQKGTMEVESEIVGKPNGNGIMVERGTEMTFKCPFVSCIFGTPTAGSAVAFFTGGEPAIYNYVGILSFFKGDGTELACTGKKDGTGTAKWNAVYDVTPSPLYFE
jgi:hypothetical protein